MKDLEPPILTVEEAVRRSSFIDVPPFLYPKQVGDISKGMAEADHKIISAEVLKSLIYFSSLVQCFVFKCLDLILLLMSTSIMYIIYAHVRMYTSQKNLRRY